MKRLPVYIIVLLVVLTIGCTTEAERRQMRDGLDSINLLNRNDQPFTKEDVQPYVQFFDEHGTPNDRMLAYYLLGRAYYEHGEAPMALQYYHDAIDCADTTDTNCDFAQLSRVYSQMAEIFYYQGLYRLQLDYDKLAETNAYKGRDTLAALMCYEEESQAYRNLNQPDSLIFICERVYQQYIIHGYHDYAASALGLTLSSLVKKGDFAKTKSYMDIYEKESCFFDTLGNIEHGREIYYKIKGNYYIGIGLLDSAEYYFRKELKDGLDFDNQNAGSMGLVKIYQQRNNPDSIAKYLAYAYAMNDSVYVHKTTKEVERIQSMYNYTRHQEIAKKESQNATRRTQYIWICMGVILFLLLIVTIMLLFIQDSRNKQKKIEREYLQSLLTIEQVQKDIALLQMYKEFNSQLIKEKKELIRNLRDKSKSLLQTNRRNQEVATESFKQTPICVKFNKYSDCGLTPPNNDWTELQDAIFKAFPGFSDFMQSHYQDLSDREYKICLLIRADYKPLAIANMLGIAAPTITQTRIELYRKLFNKQGKSKDFDSMLKRIY